MNHRLPAFTFPAEAGSRLPNLEGWKAELAWVAGYKQPQNTTIKMCLKTAKTHAVVVSGRTEWHFVGLH